MTSLGHISVRSGFLFPGGRNVIFDHLPPFRDEIKNVWSYISVTLVASTDWTRTIFLYLNNLGHVTCIKSREI